MKIRLNTAFGHIRLVLLALPFWACPSQADFIDTTWTVTNFTGEAWFIEPDRVIGQTQTFNRGFAEGVFYNCTFDGQTMAYNTYENADFFSNPEFDRFIALKDKISRGSHRVYAHRITCESHGHPEKRQVLYPFVTNETRSRAWYLFEGGVFSFSSASKPDSSAPRKDYARLTCSADDHEAFVIEVNKPSEFGPLLCVWSPFAIDMTPCAPIGGWGLSRATGMADLIEVTYDSGQARDHYAGKFKVQRQGDVLEGDAFFGSSTGLSSDGTVSDEMPNWSVWFDHETQIGELARKREHVSFECLAHDD